MTNIEQLIVAYATHEHSGYTTSRPRTRANAYYKLERLRQDCGTTPIAKINAGWLIGKYQQWSEGGAKRTWAHELISLVRRLCGFGVAFLEDAECLRVCNIMGELTFKKGGSRKQRLTVAQVVAIVTEANRIGRASIALGQGMMWDFGWRQTDAIGEYIGRHEPDVSTIGPTRYGKYVRGVRWENLADDLVLRHVTSKRDTESEIPILYAPLVLQQLRLMFGSVERSALPARGPMIVNEKTGWPYPDWQFREDWREIADAVGIPKQVQNRDSRAGRATDAHNRNIPVDKIQDLLGHKDRRTTEIYLRDPAGVTAAVMKQLSETVQ